MNIPMKHMYLENLKSVELLLSDYKIPNHQKVFFYILFFSTFKILYEFTGLCCTSISHEQSQELTSSLLRHLF